MNHYPTTNGLEIQHPKPGARKTTASATTDAEPAAVRPKKAATSLTEAKASALDLLEEKPKRVRRKPEARRAAPRTPPLAPAEPSRPAKPPKVTLAEQKGAGAFDLDRRDGETRTPEAQRRRGKAGHRRSQCEQLAQADFQDSRREGGNQDCAEAPPDAAPAAGRRRVSWRPAAEEKPRMANHSIQRSFTSSRRSSSRTWRSEWGSRSSRSSRI